MCKKNLINDEIYLCDTCYSYLKINSKLKKNENIYYIYLYNFQIKRLLSDYKLKNRKYLRNILSEIVEKKIKKIILEEKINIVIPVPISEERMLERGFNQVEEILDISKIKYEKIIRVKNTKHMYIYKNKEERVANVINSFKIDLELQDKNILLVDDILTTGATMEEIIREIKRKYKVGKICIFSFATTTKFLKRGRKHGN
ncbi:MAG: ComF family protein [Fusobacteriaceae bacterium]